MSSLTILLILLMSTSAAYYVGWKRSFSVARGGVNRLHSLPVYHGLYTAMWALGPALLFFALWALLQGTVITRLVVAELPDEIRQLPPARLNLVVNDIKNLAYGKVAFGTSEPRIRAAADRYIRLERSGTTVLLFSVLALALLSGTLAWRTIRPDKRARNAVERMILGFLMAASTVAILTTLGIVASVLFESLRFFNSVSLTEFIFGLDWSPQTAIREDQVGSSGAFGAVPLFAGTLLISLIAMLVAVPVGLMSAIYLSEYAGRTFRSTVKPLLEILAGIPTVVYGFFAALTVAPFIRDLGETMGLNVASESALAAGLVMGIMIIPFVSSLSDDVINAVPQAMRDGAYALGSTQSETIRRVIVPAALPGIVGGVLLAISRAIGETMIVVMAAGLAANLTANPLQAVTTVTVQIVTLLTGDQEFDSPKTLAAFALGLVLFLVTLALNVFALHIVRKYREQYE
ncbi:MAG: phosphate ABC transporter permease subunit PstC [Kiloniellales bacterium]|nr:phosphate ABC transporter permease subunit PstC [Kiloniellales bacterium]